MMLWTVALSLIPAHAEEPGPPPQATFDAPATEPVDTFEAQKLSFATFNDTYWGIELRQNFGHPSPLINNRTVGWPPLYGWDGRRAGLVLNHQRVDMPGLLHTVGDLEAERSLRRRIRRNRGASVFLKGLAAAGLAGSATVIVAGVQAEPYQRMPYQTAGLLTVLGSAASLFAAGLPGRRADELRWSHQASMTDDELVARVSSYNRQLAASLNLDQSLPDGALVPTTDPPAKPTRRPESTWSTPLLRDVPAAPGSGCEWPCFRTR